MLRKINFTERARIPKSALSITVQRGEDGVLTFEPVLKLDGITAPPDAQVYLEAHYGASYMRFHCGNLAEPTIPADRRLTEIDSENVVHFRLKIVDAKRRRQIIALADDVTVSARERSAGSLISLLPVNFRDLGDEVWRVDVDEIGGPMLALNSRIESMDHTARHDARFFALVYPAVVRSILTHILLVDVHEPSEEDEWWGLWIRWALGFTSSPLPAGDEVNGRQIWIDEVVESFAARHRVRTLFVGDPAPVETD